MLSNHLVTKIDPETKQIEANGQTFAYDKLLIGTGAQAIKPSIQGIEHEGVFTLRWIGVMLVIDEFITERQVKEVVIVGGGYIGVEMADSLRLRGLQVDLVEFQPTVLQTLDAPFGEQVASELSRHGVQIFTETKVAGITPIENGLLVQGSNSYEKACQLVLVVVGAKPNSSLAATAGVTVNARGAIQTDRQMQTNLSDVYAAGDCAETFHALLQQQVYLPLGTTAHKQGRIAGANMLGQTQTFQGVLGSQVVKIFDLVAGRTGLHDRDAVRYQLPALTVESEHWDHKVYYPGAHNMWIRITGNPETGQLLGAQIIGSKHSEVAKRIDIVATAIHHGYTVEQLSDLDLTYTPPLSSPWDPVQMAAQAWSKALYMA